MISTEQIAIDRKQCFADIAAVTLQRRLCSSSESLHSAIDLIEEGLNKKIAYLDALEESQAECERLREELKKIGYEMEERSERE